MEGVLPKNRIHRILICDDHELIRTGIKAQLKSYFPENIRIEEANNGIDALKKFDEMRPDLVFMDIEMPKKNGISACVSMKQIMPSAIIIIISSHNSPILYRSIRSARANGYISKTDDPARIIDSLESIILKNHFYSPFFDKFHQNNKKIELNDDCNDIMTLIFSLTSSEKKVLELIVEGKKGEEIASILFVTVKSVNNYRNRICNKFSLPPENNSLNNWVFKNKEILHFILIDTPY